MTYPQATLLLLLLLLIELAGIAAIIGVNISLLRRRLPTWNTEAAALFVITLGRLAPRQTGMWKSKGLSDNDVCLVLKFQRLVLIEVFVGSLIIMSVFALIGNHVHN
jgi:hypothetical protein